MPNPSGIKGDKFQREVSQFFNKLYETNEFSSTPSSGALVGGKNWKRSDLSERVREIYAGDLVVPPWFYYVVECKHYKNDPNYAKIIGTNDKVLDGWINECLIDSANVQRVPLIAFKTNYKGSFFVFPVSFLEFLQEIEKVPSFYLHYGEDFVIFSWDHILGISKEIVEFANDEVWRGVVLTWLNEVNGRNNG